MDHCSSTPVAQTSSSTLRRSSMLSGYYIHKIGGDGLINILITTIAIIKHNIYESPSTLLDHLLKLCSLLFELYVELSLQRLGQQVNVAALGVVLHCVVERKVHVRNEVVQISVGPALQPLVNSSYEEN